MSKKTEAVLAIREVELKEMYWLDHYYLGGVDYRFGWDGYYVVVFRGTKETGPVRGPITKAVNQ